MCTRDVHFSPCCGSRWLPRVGCNLAGCVRHPGLVAPELLRGGKHVDYPADPRLPGRAHRGLAFIPPPGVLPSWSGPISTRFCSASPSACQWGPGTPLRKVYRDRTPAAPVGGAFPAAWAQT